MQQLDTSFLRPCRYLVSNPTQYNTYLPTYFLTPSHPIPFPILFPIPLFSSILHYTIRITYNPAPFIHSFIHSFINSPLHLSPISPTKNSNPPPPTPTKQPSSKPFSKRKCQSDLSIYRPSIYLDHSHRLSFQQLTKQQRRAVPFFSEPLFVKCLCGFVHILWVRKSEKKRLLIYIRQLYLTLFSLFLLSPHQSSFPSSLVGF
jgi:hypothetical protein